jgi:hypothetical protein
VVKTTETQSQAEQLKPAAPSKKSKSILALAVFALGLNATAAVYTLSPSDFALPNVSGLVAELLPQVPIPDAVVAALNNIQSAQQHNATALHDNGFLLQQNTALLQQNGFLFQENTALRQENETKLDSLRSSLTDEQSDVKTISAQIMDEHVDVKKMSVQISTLIAKVDSLQNAILPEITSSIPKGRARNRLAGAMHKRIARQPKTVGTIGGTPLGFPATKSARQG